MSWMGHPVADLATQLGANELELCWILHRHITEIRSGLAAAVMALYDELWDVPGPYGQAAEFAARHRWVPPLAWDERGDVCLGHSEPGDCPGHDIEDPAAVPVPGWQRPRRKLPAVERLADVAEVLPSLATRQEVAWRMGVSRSHADTLVSRARAAGGAW
jgi:hypothetical protein